MKLTSAQLQKYVGGQIDVVNTLGHYRGEIVAITVADMGQGRIGLSSTLTGATIALNPPGFDTLDCRSVAGLRH